MAEVLIDSPLSHGDPGGVYHRAQLEELGIDAKQVRRLRAGGELILLRRGWYAHRRHDPAVAAAVRAGGCLSCVDALRHYGYWVADGYPHPHRRLNQRAAAEHGSCRLLGGAAPITHAVDSPLDALSCAAHCLSDEDWIATCDSILNHHKWSTEHLRGHYGPLPGRVRKLLAKTDPAAQSGTESILRVRLRALGFEVESQPKIPEVGHVDLRVGRLAIECDGMRYHFSRESYETDRRRDRRLHVAGWIPLRYTYDEILYGWSETLAEIREFTDLDRHRDRRTR